MPNKGDIKWNCYPTQKNDIAALVKETPLHMGWEMDIVYDKT